MKEFVEKLISRLEKQKIGVMLNNKCCKHIIDKSIEIVNQLAEEYKTKDCSKCSRRSWYQKGYADAENHYMKVINEQHMLIDETKNTNGWIPCAERLPEDDGKRYIVQKTNGFIDILGFTKDAYKLSRYDFVEYRGKKKALFYDYDSEYGYCEWECEAWQPLPPKFEPKEE